MSVFLLLYIFLLQLSQIPRFSYIFWTLCCMLATCGWVEYVVGFLIGICFYSCLCISFILSLFRSKLVIFGLYFYVEIYAKFLFLCIVFFLFLSTEYFISGVVQSLFFFFFFASCNTSMRDIRHFWVMALEMKILLEV